MKFKTYVNYILKFKFIPKKNNMYKKKYYLQKKIIITI